MPSYVYRPDGPVPELTRELIPYLRACFLERAPRSSDEFESTLKLGAKLELIDWLDERIQRQERGEAPPTAESQLNVR